MKNKLFLLALILISRTSYSQFYTAFEAAISDSEKIKQDIAWVNSDIPVAFDLRHHNIRVETKIRQYFRILKTLGRYSDDEGKHVFLQASDKDGVKCRLETTVYRPGSGRHVATLVITYSNIWFIYRLKKTK